MTQNTYPKRPQSKPGRVSLATKDFDYILEDQGCRVRITPAVVCPRRTGNRVEVGDTNHDLNCPICFGSMVVDLTVDAYEVWAFIQGIKIDKTFDQNSRFDVKDASMTVPHDARISYWFKVEVIDFGSIFNELVLRNGKADKDRLRYPPIDPSDGNTFALVDEDGTRFTKDVHYSITGREINWLSSTRPKKDNLYSFIYPILPTFRILELMHNNRYYYNDFKSPVKTPIQLPQQAHIRWDYLVSGGGSDVRLK